MNSLFETGHDEPARKDAIGAATVAYRRASSILTQASGFMDSYDYTLNPYGGCTFGCTYCYAAFFSRSEEKMNHWGYWTEVKENALALLQKFRKKNLNEKIIYMSSVTDPYQPIEREAKITRVILEELLEYHPRVRLVIQTRSPIIIRDVELLQRFERLQVNMTITTDSETVRKAFEPLCPSNKIRLKTVKQLVDAGIKICITMTPLLPLENPEDFANQLLETGCTEFIVQPFHKDKGKFVRGTREEAMRLFKEMGWNDESFHSTLTFLKEKFPNVGVGKSGFAPPL